MEFDGRISAEKALEAFENGMQAIESAGIDLDSALDRAFRAALLMQAEAQGMQVTNVKCSDFLDKDGDIDKGEFMRRVRESHMAVINPNGSVSLIGPTTNPKKEDAEPMNREQRRKAKKYATGGIVAHGSPVYMNDGCDCIVPNDRINRMKKLIFEGVQHERTPEVKVCDEISTYTSEGYVLITIPDGMMGMGKSDGSDGIFNGENMLVFKDEVAMRRFEDYVEKAIAEVIERKYKNYKPSSFT